MGCVKPPPQPFQAKTRIAEDDTIANTAGNLDE
jgi:hypothetical protein